MAEAAATKTDDGEAMRIALADRVKDAKKVLADAEQAAIVSAKPTITEFSGFSNLQKGVQVGMFSAWGTNLMNVNPMLVTINGHSAKVTGMSNDFLKGIVPQDVKVGPAKIKAGETTFEGAIL